MKPSAPHATVVVDVPVERWFRPGEQPPGRTLAVATRTRDLATAHALRSYLQSRPRVDVRRTVDTSL